MANTPKLARTGGATVSAHENGGPAFPVPGLSNLPNGDFIYPEAGMTLRDYFAAKAMQAMLSGHFSRYGHEEYWDRNTIACDAYFAADAMLKARTK